MTNGHTIGHSSWSTLTDRHAVLARGYGGADDPENPADVLAMPVVLHIPKINPPARSDVLAAAALATLRLCLDERVGAGGPWHDGFANWTAGRIRKVARRARGAQWRAAEEVPGVSAQVGCATARAFAPGPVGNLDPRLRKLQIGGTEMEPDDPGPPDAPLVLWVNASLAMSVGKTAAQVSHAVMLAAGAVPAERAAAWCECDAAIAVRDAYADTWARLVQEVRAGRAVGVRDAGFTEVAPGSMTVVAVVGSGSG